jgi:hypothetical protein
VGLLSARVAKVEIRAEGQGTVSVRPISPSRAKSRRLCWLRNVRFLEAFLDPGSVVLRITGLDAHGKTVYVARRHESGSFFRKR